MSDTLEQAMLESELALADETLITPVNEYLLIDPETRLIEVPESESLFGVYSENDVEVKHFACPKIVLNNIDLSQMYIFINYVSASGRYGQTLAKNIKTSEDGNYITFDWELTGNVFDSNTNGKIYFAVMAKKQMEDKEPVFATRKASGDCYETIEAGEIIQEQHADIILEMLTRIEALEKGGTGGSSFSGKASDVSYDDTETKLGVDNVQDAISKVSEEIDYLKGSNVEPSDDDIPKVYFTGTLPTAKSDGEVKVKISYKSKTEEFDHYATLKIQGGSSVNYPKKNFTLKMYEDEALETKIKRVFKNWGKLNKWVLKAHWIDHSHVRNVGTAKIWGKIVRSRSDYESLPTELKNAPNNGATDGFTVKVFANGIYQGLYEWIVPKDKLFGQDGDNANHSIMNSEWNDQDTCAFNTTTPVIDGNWSEELQDNLSDEISTSFSNFIKFVAGSTDEEFVVNAENYFDVQSIIDFDIFARVFCIVDNLCRNQIFFTYDGVKWYEGAWDVDAILGLPPTTRGFFSYDTEFQKGYLAYKVYGIINLLYQRVETLFMDRFKERYTELRSSVLSVENIIEVYERLMDVIKTYDGLLEEDFASTTGNGQFTGIPYTSENNIQQIRNFVAQRIPYMDEVIANMVKPVACTGITLNTNTLSFTAEGSQTLVATVTPDECTDAVIWKIDNTSIATVDNGVVTAIANGSATITATCGNYSATCSVSVSGLVEPVACTGITLDSPEISFAEIGATKTLIATTTPSDTTDVIVWTSDNTSVATVVDGLVTTIGYGECTITATCGNYSATCTISVNEVVDSFENSSWTEGYYNATGVIENPVTITMYHSALMPIHDGTVNANISGNTYLRISYFDENCMYLGYDTGNGFNVQSTTYNSTTLQIDTTVENAKYFVVNANTYDKSKVEVIPATGGDTGGDDTTEDIATDFESSLWTEGFFNDSGEIKTDATLKMHHSSYMPIISGTVNFGSVTYGRLSYFDADLKYIGYDRGKGLNMQPTNASPTSIAVSTTVENAIYYAISGNTTDKANITVAT